MILQVKYNDIQLNVEILRYYKQYYIIFLVLYM